MNWILLENNKFQLIILGKKIKKKKNHNNVISSIFSLFLFYFGGKCFRFALNTHTHTKKKKKIKNYFELFEIFVQMQNNN